MTESRLSDNHVRSNTGAGRQPVRWRVMIWWMLATSLGFTLGLAALVRVDQGTALFEGGTWRSIVKGLLFGSVAAASQWFVLRRLMRAAGGWIIASALGSAAGFALLSGEASTGETFPLATAVVGAIVGLFQWAVLRRRVSHAGWWVLATIASAALIGSFPVVALSGIGLVGSATALMALFSILLGLGCLVAAGAIQGGVLVNLLRR